MIIVAAGSQEEQNIYRPNEIYAAYHILLDLKSANTEHILYTILAIAIYYNHDLALYIFLRKVGVYFVQRSSFVFFVKLG